MKWPVFLGILLALVASLPLPSISSAGEMRVRVLFAAGLTTVMVKGENLAIMEGVGEWPVIKDVQRASFRIMGDPFVHLEGTDERNVSFSVSSREGFCEVNGTPIRGRVHVFAGQTGLTVVVSLPLESYLVGLVNGEVSSAWPLEAVKAQVVAARTYALGRMAHKDPLYDVRPDTGSQVYPGVFAEDWAAARAVAETRGLALFRGKDLVRALFHSTCGGRTAAAEEVWGSPDPTLVSVECGDCGNSPQARWETAFSAAEVEAAVSRLYPGAGRLLSLTVRSRVPSGRVRTLSVTAEGGAFLVDAGDLRRELGTVRLPSTFFDLRREGDRLVFVGRGYGHGVGLCQWGARGAAARGESFTAILGRYYPGSEVRRAY